MKILLVEPGQVPRTEEISPTLESMQKVVGGPIQAMYPFDEPVSLVCNEEGKLYSLPLNRSLHHPDTGEIYDIVAGTFFLCAAPLNSESFAGLTEEQITRYSERFHAVEYFLGGDDL